MTATTSGGATGVEFLVDDESVGIDADGADGWSVNWDTTSSADGTHTITAVASDAADSTVQDEITVTVANDSTPGGDTMHVSDLDGSATNGGATWTALATIAVSDSSGQPVAGATVAGTWSSGSAPQCTTDVAGRCTVALPGIAKRVGSVGFSVSDVAGRCPTTRPPIPIPTATATARRSRCSSLSRQEPVPAPGTEQECPGVGRPLGNTGAAGTGRQYSAPTRCEPVSGRLHLHGCDRATTPACASAPEESPEHLG